MNYTVEFRGSTRSDEPVADPAQPFPDHRSDESALIPDGHEAVVSSRKIVFRDEVRLDALVPVEAYPVLDDILVCGSAAEETSGSFSRSDPAGILECFDFLTD